MKLNNINKKHNIACVAKQLKIDPVIDTSSSTYSLVEKITETATTTTTRKQYNQYNTKRNWNINKNTTTTNNINIKSHHNEHTQLRAQAKHTPRERRGKLYYEENLVSTFKIQLRNKQNQNTRNRKKKTRTGLIYNSVNPSNVSKSLCETQRQQRNAKIIKLC